MKSERLTARNLMRWRKEVHASPEGSPERRRRSCDDVVAWLANEERKGLLSPEEIAKRAFLMIAEKQDFKV